MLSFAPKHARQPRGGSKVHTFTPVLLERLEAENAQLQCGGTRAPDSSIARCESVLILALGIVLAAEDHCHPLFHLCLEI